MHTDRSSPVCPTALLPDAERQARESIAAKCSLAGAIFKVTDDRGAPVFGVNEGSATHLFRNLEEVDDWLEAGSEVTQ